MGNILKNYLSTVLFIGIISLFYFSNTYYQDFLFLDLYLLDQSFNSIYIYLIVIVTYLVLLLPFYYFEGGKSKARIVLEYFGKKWKNKNYEIKKEEKTAMLAWGVKGFFVPLMLIWVSQNFITFVNKIYFGYKNFELFSTDFLLFFNLYIFFGLLYFIIFIDVIFFTLGYLLESKYLKNVIKSVEPTMFGWVVALICYPPFNISLGKIFSWYSEEFPKFENFYVHIGLNILLLLFFIIYSWASVALGLKASNLTNRGIVKKGPYKFIRHPAYISKNISWFIGTIPAYIIAISTMDIQLFFLITLALLGWGYIYYLRAITEEKHLSEDPEYLAYKKQVKYKFIPGIW